MGKVVGNTRRLFVQSATPGTFSEILGQRDLDTPRKASTIDIGDKNSAPYGLTAPGNFDVSITLTGIPDLPDANGLQRVDSVYKAQTAEVFQVRKAPYSGGDVVFECLCNVLDCSPSFPRDKEASYSITLGLAAAPTVDTLFG
jgi:predicted secreted protein